LMSDLHQSRAGNVWRRRNDVTNRIEAGCGPCMNEGVQFRVAVESHAELVALEEPIQLRINGDDGSRVVVVRERAAPSVPVSPRYGGSVSTKSTLSRGSSGITCRQSS